jgi:hypothetical protein
MHRLLPIGVLALFLIVAVYGYFESNSGTSAETSSAPEASGIGPTSGREALVNPVEDLRVQAERAVPRASARTETAGEEPSVEVPSGAEATSASAWTGRLELVRLDGSLMREVDGSFQFMLWRNNRGRSETVEVREGRFEFPVEEGRDGGDALDSGSFAIEPEFGSFGDLHGGPWVDLQVPPSERADKRPWLPGETVVVRLRELAPVQLDVRDAVTGQPIGRVDLALDSDVSGWGDPPPLPGPDPKLWREAVPVPVELSLGDLPGYAQRALELALRVGARGYAWKGVKLDLGQGPARIELEPGGRLEIQVAGVPEGVDDLKLTLHGSEYYLGTWPLRGNGLLSFEGLPTGRAFAQVHRSEWFSIDKTFAEAAAEVVAGGAAAMDLTVDASAATPVREFDVALRMTVPAAWEIDSLNGLLSLIESPAGGDGMQGVRLSPDEAAGGAMLFRSPELRLQEGVWAFDGRTLPWRCTFAVDGDGEIRMEVPEPVETLVRLVDIESGAPPEAASVGWYVRLDGRARSHSIHSAEPGEAPGEFRLRSPVGPLQVSAKGPLYLAESRQLDADQLGGVEVFELRRAQGIRLRLRDPDGQVPRLSNYWSIEFTPAEGEAAPGDVLRSGNEKELRITVAEPGSYRLVFPEFSGFEPVAPRDVEVEPGRLIDVEVTLEPTRL